MNKKTQQGTNEAYLANYREMVRKIQVLSRIAARQAIGTRPDGDPRTEYFANAEASLRYFQMQLQTLTTLALAKMGISREEYLKASEKDLAEGLAGMEKDLCVTGWDPTGNPTLDLPAYLERTKTWPK